MARPKKVKNEEVEETEESKYMEKNKQSLE